MAGELDATIMRRASKVAKTNNTKASRNVRPAIKSDTFTSPVIAAPHQPIDSDEEKAQKLAEMEAHLASLPRDTSRSPLDFNVVRKRVAVILAEELHMDADTVMSLSDNFEFDDETPLDEYGLDSVTAMRIAGRLSVEFDLRVPLSPFMFLSEPTLNGMCKVHQTMPAATSAKKRMEQKQNLIQQQQEGNEMKVNDNISNVSHNDHYTPTHRRSEPINGNANISTAIGSLTNNNVSKSSVIVSSSSPTSLPCVLGIGTAVPGPGAPQVAITEIMIEGMKLDDKKSKLFRTIGSTTQIERRYSVLPGGIESIYYGRVGIGNDEGIETRNKIFKCEAPILAKEAAEKAIKDWGGDKSLITHVIAVTCTGVIVPGLELGLMFDLGLSTTAQRVALTYMGCFGALSGMKTAKAFAAEKSVNNNNNN